MIKQVDKIYDELLVMRCQGGEQMAFEILVQRWQIPLVKFATIVCRNNELAREAVQDSWLAIIRGIKKLRDPARFRHWALRIVHHKCVDLLRQQKPIGSTPAGSITGRHELDCFEDQEEIITILGSLNDAHRTVLALHYLQDMGVAEMSILLNIPDGTVKSRLHHAREAFRKILETEEA